MSQCLNLLDQALDIGRQELDLIAAEDVESLDDVASKRDALLAQAWEAKEKESVDVEELLLKLRQLRNLQGQLTREARALHKRLEADLLRTKKETKRFAGYGKVAKVTPLFKGMYNKQG